MYVCFSVSLRVQQPETFYIEETEHSDTFEWRVHDHVPIVLPTFAPKLARIGSCTAPITNGRQAVRMDERQF